MRFLPLSRFTGLSFLCVAVLAVAPRPATAAEPKWLKLKTADFSIYTDASPRNLEEFAMTYAAFREVSRAYFAGPGRPLPGSIVVLFRDQDDLKKHAPKPKEKDFRITAFTTEVDRQAATSHARSSNTTSAGSKALHAAATSRAPAR